MVTALQALPAAATTGDLVSTVHFSSPCTSGVGVGIAFDGTNLWYSCALDALDLHRATGLLP